MCFLSLSTTFVWNTSHSKKNSTRYPNVHVSSVKYQLFLSDFNQTLVFRLFSKNNQITNFTKICPVGVELFHAGKLTNMMKLTVTFQNFENMPN